MIKKLTDRFLQTVKPPAAGRLVIVDSEARGLTFRITPGGVQSWCVRYRIRRQDQQHQQPQKTYTLPDDYPTVSLAEARLRAHAIRSAAKDGRDLPAEEKRLKAEQKKAAASARTVRQLASEYIEGQAKPHQRQWRDLELRVANHVLPRIGERSVADVRRVDIVELLDHLQHEKGLKQQTNRVRTTLASMFQYAVEREYVDVNPVFGTRHRKLESERSRTLDDAELKAVWRALDQMREPGRSFVRALMLTAGRRDEVREMRWDEINAADDLWTLPASRNKSGRDHQVPLSTYMVELLAKLPRLGPFVFTVSGDGPWQSHGKFKVKLDDESGISNWRYHDLRRTVRSGLAEMGVSFEIAEKILGHAMTKIERTYNRHSYRAEKARALQAWADKLLAIVGDGHAAPNVLPMQRTQA